MSVLVGSARIDENGHARGGKPGDQTGRELSTQNWYLHSKGWRVFRPIDPLKAERAAWAMQAACDSPYIGYDQGDRLTLYYAARDVGFNPALVKTKCETDCSALVRVCEAYAGIKLPNFTTPGEPKVLLESHEFMELVGDKYTKSASYLKRGDVLVTRTQGHTVIVLTDGSKADHTPVKTDYELGDRILRNGCEGNDVKELQGDLIELGYSCGSWGCDGDFGDATEIAVKAFQARAGLEEDGEVGPIAVAITLNGVAIPDSVAIVTPAAVEDVWHINTSATITVPCGCCVSVSAAYVDATEDDAAVTPTPSIFVRRRASLTVTRTA